MVTLTEEVQREDEDLQALEKSLEAETVLSTALFQATQKLDQMTKAQEHSVSSEPTSVGVDPSTRNRNHEDYFLAGVPCIPNGLSTPNQSEPSVDDLQIRIFPEVGPAEVSASQTVSLKRLLEEAHTEWDGKYRKEPILLCKEKQVSAEELDEYCKQIMTMFGEVYYCPTTPVHRNTEGAVQFALSKETSKDSYQNRLVAMRTEIRYFHKYSCGSLSLKESDGGLLYNPCQPRQPYRDFLTVEVGFTGQNLPQLVRVSGDLLSEYTDLEYVIAVDIGYNDMVSLYANFMLLRRQIPRDCDRILKIKKNQRDEGWHCQGIPANFDSLPFSKMCEKVEIEIVDQICLIEHSSGRDGLQSDENIRRHVYENITQVGSDRIQGFTQDFSFLIDLSEFGFGNATRIDFFGIYLIHILYGAIEHYPLLHPSINPIKLYSYE